MSFEQLLARHPSQLLERPNGLEGAREVRLTQQECSRHDRYA